MPAADRPAPVSRPMPHPARAMHVERLRGLAGRMDRSIAGDSTHQPDLRAASDLHGQITRECMQLRIPPHEVGLHDLPRTAEVEAAAPELQRVLLSADQAEGIRQMEAHFAASATCRDCGDEPCDVHRLFILAGPAGSGKSTLVGAIQRRYTGELEGMEPPPVGGWIPDMVVTAAPTNAAVQRLREVGQWCVGTYHVLAYERPVTDEQSGALLGFVPRAEGSMVLGGTEGPEDHCNILLILDEASMADEKIRLELLAAVPRAVRVLAMGDPCQLPPVKGRPGFALDRPDHLLTQIHRQGEGSLLAAITKVREDKLLLTPATVRHLGGQILRVTPETLGTALAIGARSPGAPGGLRVLLVQSNWARYRTNRAAREAQSFPPMDQGPQYLERVIAYSTNHNLRVYNSELGTVVVVQEGPQLAGELTWKIEVQWDGLKGRTEAVVPRQSWHPSEKPESPASINAAISRIRATAPPQDTWNLLAVQPAYALTVHKAQGLEYEGGGILLERRNFMGKEGWKLAYTAISRFKQWVQFLELVAAPREVRSGPQVDPLPSLKSTTPVIPVRPAKRV